MDIARSSLSDTELFLNNGFKTIFAKDLVALILKWFDEKFMVIYRADAIKVMRKFANPKENTVYIERTLTDAARHLVYAPMLWDIGRQQIVTMFRCVRFLRTRKLQFRLMHTNRMERFALSTSSHL